MDLPSNPKACHRFNSGVSGAIITDAFSGRVGIGVQLLE